MSYQTKAEIKERIKYDGSEVVAEDAATGTFDDLLDTLESESRAMIESYKGDVTFSEETDVVKEIEAPDDVTIALDFPVNDVSKVEVKYRFTGGWNTLDSDYYYHSEHNLILGKTYPKRNINSRNRRKNPATRYLYRGTWADICYKVKVTYDRGYSTIPSNVKSVQITLINNMLRQLRLEQSIAAIEPDAVGTYLDAGKIMTEDVTDRLDQMTSFGGTTVVI